MLAMTFPFFSEVWYSPVSSSISRNGFRERSVLLRSMAIIRLKVSSGKTLRSATESFDGSNPGLEPLPERCEFTTSSACAAWSFAVRASDLILIEGNFCAGRLASEVMETSGLDGLIMRIGWWLAKQAPDRNNDNSHRDQHPRNR